MKHYNYIILVLTSIFCLSLCNNTAIGQDLKKYYLIAGSYKSETEAQHTVDSLKAIGYPSEIVGKSNYGTIRISFNSFDSYTDATKELNRIKSQITPNVWILEAKVKAEKIDTIDAIIKFFDNFNKCQIEFNNFLKIKGNNFLKLEGANVNIAEKGLIYLNNTKSYYDKLNYIINFSNDFKKVLDTVFFQLYAKIFNGLPIFEDDPSSYNDPDYVPKVDFILRLESALMDKGCKMELNSLEEKYHFIYNGTTFTPIMKTEEAKTNKKEIIRLLPGYSSNIDANEGCFKITKVTGGNATIIEGNLKQWGNGPPYNLYNSYNQVCCPLTLDCYTKYVIKNYGNDTAVIELEKN